MAMPKSKICLPHSGFCYGYSMDTLLTWYPVLLDGSPTDPENNRHLCSPNLFHLLIPTRLEIRVGPSTCTTVSVGLCGKTLKCWCCLEWYSNGHQSCLVVCHRTHLTAKSIFGIMLEKSDDPLQHFEELLWKPSKTLCWLYILAEGTQDKARVRV